MAGLKILLADDNLFIRTTLKSIIEAIPNKGYQVIGLAENGKEAVSLYRKLRPDILLCDITMPIMDGLGAVKKIVSEFPDAYIVMCSAIGQESIIIQALTLGAAEFLIKPYNPEIIENLLLRSEQKIAKERG